MRTDYTQTPPASDRRELYLSEPEQIIASVGAASLVTSTSGSALLGLLSGVGLALLIWLGDNQ